MVLQFPSLRRHSTPRCLPTPQPESSPKTRLHEIRVLKDRPYSKPGDRMEVCRTYAYNQGHGDQYGGDSSLISG